MVSVSRRIPLLALLLTILISAAPAAAETWIPIGPGGGELRALVVAPSNLGVVYAGTQGGGVYKSEDGAATWTTANSGLTNLSVLTLAVHPRNAAIAYAGTLGDGMFKTSNGGVTWNPLSFPNPFPFSLAIDPRKPTTLYAGTAGQGVYKSTDGGGSWRAANRSLGEAVVRSIAVHPRNSSIVYIAVESGPQRGVFKSTNGGTTWRAINNGLPDFSTAAGPFSVVLDPENPDTLYTDPIGAGVYRSTNGGSRWTRTNMGLGYPLAVGPTGVLWAGPARKSLNRGNTVIRTRWTDGIGSDALAVHPRNGDVVYAGHVFAGISKTEDGGRTWKPRNQGFWASTIATLEVAPESPSRLYATATGQGFFRTWNGGASWWRRPSPTFEITKLAVDPAVPSTLYGVVNGYDLEKSTDRGVSWVHLPVADPECLEIQDLAVDPLHPANLYVVGIERNGRCPGDCYAYRSTNAGTTWSCMSAAGGSSVIEIDPQNSSILYAFNGSLLKSVDQGTQWSQAGQGLPEILLALAIDPSVTSTLYAGTREGIFKSTDSGQTWQPSSTGLPAGHIASVVIHPEDSNVIYAGLTDTTRDGSPTPGISPSDLGVYVSTDAGANWIWFGGGLPPALFNGHLVIDPAAPHTLYAGTNDGGVYKLTPGN